jgi:hypothetical protein
MFLRRSGIHWSSISSVLVRHLLKPAQHVPVVKFALFEIAGAAERAGAGVP